MSNINVEILYAEIINGYSRGEVKIDNNKSLVFYYRHPRHSELFELERITQTTMKEAVEMGLFTFDEALSFVMNEGWWTQEDEADLSYNQAMLKRHKDTLRVMTTKKDRDEVDRLIAPVESKISELLTRRAEYMPQTAESYANKKTNELHITKFLYKDPEFTTPLFDDDDFYMLDSKVSYLLQLEYFNLIDFFSYENIQKLASSVMFQNFLYVGGETTSDFYGIPVTKVSRYQFELFLSGQNFKNIIKNCATMERDMPENLFGNPEGMNKHYEMVKSAWESKHKINKNNGGNGATGVSRVGATPEESRMIHGGEANNGGLLAAARKNGGKLDMRGAMAKRGL